MHSADPARPRPEAPGHTADTEATTLTPKTRSGHSRSGRALAVILLAGAGATALAGLVLLVGAGVRLALAVYAMGGVAILIALAGFIYADRLPVRGCGRRAAHVQVERGSASVRTAGAAPAPAAGASTGV